MRRILLNLLAVVAGVLSGMLLNGTIIQLSGKLFPLPAGINAQDIESLNQNIHLFGPEHFSSTFLAHALGTLLGAFVAAKIAATHKMPLSIAIGAFFLMGGIYMVYLLPMAPLWFSATDLLLAYIPMAYLGGKLAQR